MDDDTGRRFTLIESEVKECSAELRDIQTILMGPPPNRTNGLRGDFTTLLKRFEAAMDWARDIWNVKRREECLGIEECNRIDSRLEDILTKLDAHISADNEREGTMKVAQVNMKGVVLAAALPSVITGILTILTLFLTRR